MPARSFTPFRSLAAEMDPPPFAKGERVLYKSSAHGEIPAKIKSLVGSGHEKVVLNIRSGEVSTKLIKKQAPAAGSSPESTAKRAAAAAGHADAPEESPAKRAALLADPALASGNSGGPSPALASGNSGGPSPALASGTAASAASGAANGPSSIAVQNDDAGEDGSSRALTSFLHAAREWLRDAVIEPAKLNFPRKSIPAKLSEIFPPEPLSKKAILDRIPWRSENGYVSFLRMPTQSCKGQIHVTMLSYAEASFSGEGLYLEDALDLLLSWHQLPDSTLHIRPRTVQSEGLDHGGWVCDGAVANATRGFAMVALAAFAAMPASGGKAPVPVPVEVVDLLSNIKVKYNKYSSTQARVVAGLVDSAINSRVNRSIEDPIYLASELRRNSLVTASGVKAALASYKNRLLASPALHMKQSTEECTLRFMQADKVTARTTAQISDCIASQSWQRCPFSAHALMAPRFVLVAKLGSWLHEFLDTHARQNSRGQILSVELTIRETPHGTKTTQDAFDSLCGCCGFWTLIEDKVLPRLGLGDEQIAGLHLDFVSHGRSGSLRSACVELMLKEPPFFESFDGMADWVKKNVAAVKAAIDEKAAQAVKAANESPAAILQDVEKTNISVGIYIGEITLDVNAYREAAKRLGVDKVDAEANYAKEKDMHVQDVRAALEHYQMSEIVIAPADLATASGVGGGGHHRGGKWIHSAVTAASTNLKRLAKVLRLNDSDIAVVNIWSLSALGTYKRQIVQKIQQSVGVLPGVSIVYLPVAPSDSYRKVDKFSTLGPKSGGPGPASGGRDDGDDDMFGVGDGDDGSEDHDFNLDEGCLPEVLTSAAKMLPPKVLARSLAKDRHEIEKVLVFDADPATHCATHLRIAHVADNRGIKDSTDALLLYPIDEDTLTGVERSTCMKHGLLTEAPLANGYVNVTRKVAMNAKRAIEENGFFETPTGSSVYTCRNKVARGQLGNGLHEHVLKDFAKTCARRVLLVNDFISASGEVGVAALATKLSEEASGNACKVCYWGFDFRSVFHHVGKARLQTEIRAQYLAGKLPVAGRTPLPVPSAPTTRTRKDIQSLLPGPLKHLSIDAEGDLVLPCSSALPVQMTEAVRGLFETLEKEFPQKTATAPEAGKQPKPASGSTEHQGGQADASAANALLAPGSVLADRAALIAAGFTILKESPAPIAEHMYVLASRAGEQQIFLESQSQVSRVVEPSTFMGKGGAGEFTQADLVSEEMALRSWRYTRLSDPKKDTLKFANGGLVLGPLSAQADQLQQIKIQTFVQIEQAIGGARDIKVYGHAITRGQRAVRITPGEPPVSWVPKLMENADGSSFSALCLGQWLRSHEVANEKQIECTGMLRPAFEVQLDAQRLLSPSPAADANALCLFSVKRFSTKPKQVMAL